MRLLIAALVALSLAAGCSSSSDPAESATGTDDPTEQFCAAANSFVTDSAVYFVTQPDAELFAGFDNQLARLSEQAPTSITRSIEVLRDGFAAIDDAYATTGYDPTAAFELSPEVQDSSRRASAELDEYLQANCALGATRETQIDQIVEAFGIEDRSIATCLHANLGDVANIDAAQLTPELMTRDVCGTSILGLLSGEPANAN